MCVRQIENASEVLITPLEKFRKEQIGAAKVGYFCVESRPCLWLRGRARGCSVPRALVCRRDGPCWPRLWEGTGAAQLLIKYLGASQFTCRQVTH